MLKRILKYTGTILTILLISASVIFAQEGSSATKAQRKADKKKQQQIVNAKKAEEKGIKKHRSIQTKEVKKRMKRNDRRFDHVDSFDRRPNFIQKIFKRKRPSHYK